MSLILTEKRGHIAILTLNRPDAMNALGAPGDGDQVAAACEAINDDQDIRCVILTGAGKAFSAGGDVKAMQAREGAFGGNGVLAIGLGCDVACMTDIRIAADTARFGVTFLKLGLIPGDGGAWLMPRTIGMSRAAELLFTGDVIDAATAKDWGLVSRVVADEALMDEARALAAKIALMPPHALRQTKSLLRQGQQTGYDTALELAANTQAMMHTTADHAEGVAALIEKRAGQFRGE